jgi:hypothetical protein
MRVKGKQKNSYSAKLTQDIFHSQFLNKLFFSDDDEKKDESLKNLYYIWQGVSGETLRRGLAFIFHDQKHKIYTSLLVEALKHVQYETQTFCLDKIDAVLGE